MSGARLRKFLSVLVLCCLAFSSSADVILTDGEYEELLKQIDSLETSLKERDKPMNERQEELMQREAELSEREAELSERVSELNERENELKQRESDLRERESSLTLKENLCQQQEKFLKEQRQEQNRARIASVLENVAWGLAGFGIGRYTR